ncbi:hypothetical protein WJX72_004357 [[Myrmecia] bisecta]|uniref:Replication protein A subunit n=1 Tax=[Myrmecia] bisecta TaxID=41462 RepID=A0AAW1PTK0_9CHLO
MAAHVKSGVVAKISSKDLENEPVALQIFGLEALNNKKYKCRFTDGAQVLDGVLSTQVSEMVAQEQIQELAILKVLDYTFMKVASGEKLVVTSCEVLGKCERQLGGPVAIKEEAASTPLIKREASGPVERTPFVQKMNAFNTPGPTPPQTEDMKKTPGSNLRGTPGSSLGSARKGLQPIQALNPYNSNWTIKARLVSKAPKRTFNRNTGGVGSVFSVELVDDQGTQIEASLWQELADKYYDTLQEGKVYYFSKGKVKPADKRYSNVRNEYMINFDAGSVIEESEDQDVGKMQARLNFVPIDQVAAFLGKKTLIDVRGVVTSVGNLGTIKRKADQTEVVRRDLTVLDQSGKTVTVTLWNKLAEEQSASLEGMETPVIAVSACRVSEYNGVSLNTVSRSTLTINPDDAEAQALREWYDTVGRTAATSHAGEGLANALQKSGGARERDTVSSIVKSPDNLPPVDAKATYHTLALTVSLIDPGQSLYYPACPDNNRKVIEKDGKWLCEYDGKVYANMTRRYVMQAKCIDATGECSFSFFNDMAEVLLGMTADEVAVNKEGGDEKEYQAVLKRAQWTDWVVNVKSITREYKDAPRQQLTISEMRPVNYAAECQRLIKQIQQLK